VAPQRARPYLVAASSGAIGLSLGGPTGYAINPARDLGPRIAHAILPIAGKGGPIGVMRRFRIGPLLGGIVAGLPLRALAISLIHSMNKSGMFMSLTEHCCAASRIAAARPCDRYRFVRSSVSRFMPEKLSTMRMQAAQNLRSKRMAACSRTLAKT